VHTYVLMVERHTIFVMPRLQLHFDRLLWHHRGWGDHPLEPQVLEAHHRTVLEQLELAKERVEYWRHMTTGPAAARATAARRRRRCADQTAGSERLDGVLPCRARS
jgi:hypothetical protein